ncbi:hypothetical protein ACFO0N_19545 [Halobium salinum]|uniref:Twin-arginine translocation signal domain-containing protein n=1 Tax=Halobium salinum TaxID=1364940 RepID=A0ABD5PHF5_9EURY|nr:hypothetical protein [Halobium salinum]
MPSASDADEDTDSPSRRRLLASLSAAGTAALAGCSGPFGSSADSGTGSESQSNAACRTDITRRGDGGLLEGATVMLDDEDAVLRFTLSESALDEEAVGWVDVDGDHEVPVVEDRREYWLRLGQRPIHDRLTLTSMSGRPASPVDHLVLEFNCFAEG